MKYKEIWASQCLRKHFMTVLKISKLQGFVWKSCKRDWKAKVVFPIKMLPTFSSHCNHYFWGTWLETLRLPYFNMLFQLVLINFSKMNCVYWKVDHVINHIYNKEQMSDSSREILKIGNEQIKQLKTLLLWIKMASI